MIDVIIMINGENTMDRIKNFLLAPDENKDEFWDSDVLIWVDWGDFDKSIIEYFNARLPKEDKIQFECVNIKKERGIDIILKKDGTSTIIPYADDCTDRDTTLKSIQQHIYPKYQIRWYMDSLGSDTLAFCIGLTSQWKQLEQEFGVENVAYYFAPIQTNSVMFEMDMDDVFDLLKQRDDEV